MIKEEIEEHGKDAEIKVCRRVIDQLKNESKEKDLLHEELEEACKQSVLCYQNKNEELKKKLRIRKKV